MEINLYLFWIQSSGQMKPRSISLVQMAFRTCGVAQEKNTEKNILYPELFKHGGGSLVVWGCMSAHGVGELHFIDGIMINADMYYKILNAEMIPSHKHLGREAIFQHDNDPNHSAMMTSAFLKKKKGKVLDWPSMFPDQELRDVI